MLESSSPALGSNKNEPRQKVAPLKLSAAARVLRVRGVSGRAQGLASRAGSPSRDDPPPPTGAAPAQGPDFSGAPCFPTAPPAFKASLFRGTVISCPRRRVVSLTGRVVASAGSDDHVCPVLLSVAGQARALAGLGHLLRPIPGCSITARPFRPVL